MKIKLSTVIAVSIIVLLFAGVAYAVTSGSAAEVGQRGNQQHETISPQEGSIEKKRLIQKRNSGEHEDHEHEDHDHVLVDFQGEVTEVNLAEGNTFKIKAENNNVYRIRVGARWFWEKEGIDISEGDKLLVKAVKDEEEGENTRYGAITIRNITTGKTATLRTPEGEALWK